MSCLYARIVLLLTMGYFSLGATTRLVKEKAKRIIIHWLRTLRRLLMRIQINVYKNLCENVLALEQNKNTLRFQPEEKGNVPPTIKLVILSSLMPY